MIVEVIINSTVKNLNKTFDYQVPTELVGTIRIGKRVAVPFGNSKALEEGFVIAIKETSSYKVKDIAWIQEGFSLKPEQIELAKWMAQRYFCNVSDAIKMMLPPGTTSKIVENRVTQKSRNFVYLKKDEEEIQKAIQEKKIKSEKQLRAIRFLQENDGVLVSDLETFIDVSRAILQTLEKNNFVEIIEKQVQRDPFLHKNIARNTELTFTQEQQIAYDSVVTTMQEKKFQTFLIKGVTGSGKTEIYLQLIKKTMEQGKTAIMLVPEISLTPQMVDRFIARFGEEKVAVLHSKLSLGERYDQWERIQRKEASIVIGARSAIFAPLEQLGLIIMDEEHDSSYKSEMIPRYQTKEIATYLARENEIPFILGSATPDLSTFYQAQKGEIQLLTLTKRANQSSLPEVEIVDLRQELANGNRSMFSQKMQELIAENLKKKQQTILFLNRRGFSTFVMCRDCGTTLTCKNCNITLTYHRKENKLKCHYCGYEQENVITCPECGSKKIKYFGTGTQKLEEEIHLAFPKATTIRMDVDTVTKKNSHEEILTAFKEQQIDILIGTQMVVKGHHFPNVTLVGVIAADSSLNIDDYRANERTFQILTQVAGRAGRENLQGRVIIQTYNPDNFSIECAKEQDYDLFYDAEIKLRKQLNYPPFCDIMVMGISAEDLNLVQETAKELQKNLEKCFGKDEQIKVFQAMPAPVDKIKNKYRWRIIIKGKMDDSMDKIHQALEKAYKANSAKVRIIIDRNPTNMM